MVRNLPARWDMETDLVTIGSGIGGLSAAITAHDHGASTIVLERSDMVGGVTALSAGLLWIAGNHLASALGIKDSVAAGFEYLRTLSMGYGTDAAILNLVAHAPLALQYFMEKSGLQMEVVRHAPDYYLGHNDYAVAEGRALEPLPFRGAALGEWQTKTRLSPHMPWGMTHHDTCSAGGTANMTKWDFALMAERMANDERCLGPGLAAWFVKDVLDRGIPLMTGTSAEELIGDGERIVGLRAKKDGQDLFIKARLGVVIATGSYERRQDYNKTLGSQLDLGSLVFSTIDGSNCRLAGRVGARLARVPDITWLGFMIPGEEDEEGSPLWRSAIPVMGLPHAIVVNRKGRRFANEAFYRSVYYAIDIIDGGNQTHPNFPCWVVFDSQLREKYPCISIMPGQDWPTGLGVVADSIAGLAAGTGIDAQGILDTIARFNSHADQGLDPEFGRGTHPYSAWACGDPFHKPNPNLGTLAKPPFYAIPLQRVGGVGVPSSGLLIDEHCRIMDWDDNPIPGLYAAGNAAARMESGASGQSGVSNTRGMTYGWLAARHATGHPSGLLEQEIRRLGL